MCSGWRSSDSHRLNTATPPGRIPPRALAAGPAGGSAQAGTARQDFELIERIGQGGMGCVYRSRQATLRLVDQRLGQILAELRRLDRPPAD